jgi:hypothetical protein
MSSNNQHIKDALCAYCQFQHAQGFAILLDGRWGSGKTHFIKSILKNLTGSEEKPALYVSLYGIASATEISEQLFQQLHPILGHKYTRLAGKLIGGIITSKIAFDIGKGAEVDASAASIDVTSFLKSAQNRTIVFDDFERALMPPAAILGYINPLIEHDDCKAIIVADESQIANKEDYLKRKEKTIGQTYQFKSDADDAFDEFLKLIDEKEARGFLDRSKSEIIGIFRDSKLDNLRLLKQALWDFERLWKVLTKEQRGNGKATDEILLLICASSIELRAGNLTAENFRLNDLAHQMALQVKKTDNSAAFTLDAVFKKYPTVEFSSTLIRAEDIVDLIVNTRVTESRIQEQLLSHPYFVAAKALPSWRALWFISDFPTADHPAVIERFRTDFYARSFRAEGEINHVIGLALRLSDLKISGWSESQIIRKLKRYIDDVYKGSSADVDDLKEDSSTFSRDGAFGLGFMKGDTPRFAELFQYHKEQRKASRLRAYPKFATQLLAQMAVDSNDFYRDVCFNSVGPSRFARVGVLKHIPPKKFVAVVAAASGEDQKRLLMSLATRYEQVAVENELQEEVPWLRQVKSRLDKEAKRLPPIARDTLSRLTNEYVSKTIAAIESRVPALAPTPG